MKSQLKHLETLVHPPALSITIVILTITSVTFEWSPTLKLNCNEDSTHEITAKILKELYAVQADQREKLSGAQARMKSVLNPPKFEK